MHETARKDDASVTSFVPTAFLMGIRKRNEKSVFVAFRAARVFIKCCGMRRVGEPRQVSFDDAV